MKAMICEVEPGRPYFYGGWMLRFRLDSGMECTCPDIEGRQPKFYSQVDIFNPQAPAVYPKVRHCPVTFYWREGPLEKYEIGKMDPDWVPKEGMIIDLPPRVAEVIEKYSNGEGRIQI